MHWLFNLLPVLCAAAYAAAAFLLITFARTGYRYRAWVSASASCSIAILLSGALIKLLYLPPTSLLDVALALLTLALVRKTNGNLAELWRLLK